MSYTGKCMIGDNNIAIGRCAMHGSSTVSNNTGTLNIAIGLNTMCTLTSGDRNIFMGCKAGYYITSGGCNVAIGTCAGGCITSGSNNVFLGSLVVIMEQLLEAVT